MPGEFVPKVSNPSTAVQREVLSYLQLGYDEQLRDEGIYSTAAEQLSEGQRLLIKQNTFACIFLGETFGKGNMELQILCLKFQAPLSNPAGSNAIAPSSMAKVANLFPRNNGIEPLDGFTLTEASCVASIMRGIILASLDGMPDISLNLDHIATANESRFSNWIPEGI